MSRLPVLDWVCSLAGSLWVWKGLLVGGNLDFFKSSKPFFWCHESNGMIFHELKCAGIVGIYEASGDFLSCVCLIILSDFHEIPWASESQKGMWSSRMKTFMNHLNYIALQPKRMPRIHAETMTSTSLPRRRQAVVSRLQSCRWNWRRSLWFYDHVPGAKTVAWKHKKGNLHVLPTMSLISWRIHQNIKHT